MGRQEGNYSVPAGHVHDELRQFVHMLQQEAAPIMDVLVNTFSRTAYVLLRRVLQNAMGPAGGPYAKFKVQGVDASISAVQNFKIAGGDGTTADGGVGSDLDHEGPARFFLGGHMALFASDRNFRDNSIARPPAHSTLTAIVGNVITDTSAFFGVYGDTLVGRPFYPDITLTNDDSGTGPVGFDILTVSDENTLVLDLDAPRNADGTASTMSPTPVTLAEMGVLAGATYRIGLTTPAAGTRVDTVILDVYEDEVDGDEDPILNRSVEGTATPSANAMAVKQRIEVLQGLSAKASPSPHGDFPLYYTRRNDRDGRVHHRVALALITRTAGQDSISDASPSDIENLEVATNDLWALTFGTLPPRITDTSILDANSGGSDLAPGNYGGQPLEIGRLLLQMLGNVSDQQNEAFQNAGDHVNQAGIVQAGDPGVGSGPYGASPNDGRHVGLFTNEELGAILNAIDMQQASAATANALLSKQGHKGSQANDGATPSGAIGDHANPTGVISWPSRFNNLFVPYTSNIDVVTLGSSTIAVGYGFTEYHQSDSDGFPLAGGGTPAIPNNATALFEDLGIPIEGINLGPYVTTSQIKAKYAVFCMAGLSGGLANGSQDLEGIVRLRDWSVVNNQLSVRVDVWVDDSERFGVWGSVILVSR